MPVPEPDPPCPVFTHKVSVWAATLESDPARVVHRLRLGQKVVGDDTKEDSNFYAALAAVEDAALGERAVHVPNPSKAIWAGLVKVGVVEALCKNILEMVQTKDLTPEEKGENVWDKVCLLQITCSVSL